MVKSATVKSINYKRPLGWFSQSINSVLSFVGPKVQTVAKSTTVKSINYKGPLGFTDNRVHYTAV